jgi:hypothetical protein
MSSEVWQRFIAAFKARNLVDTKIVDGKKGVYLVGRYECIFDLRTAIEKGSVSISGPLPHPTDVN